MHAKDIFHRRTHTHILRKEGKHEDNEKNKIKKNQK